MAVEELIIIPDDKDLDVNKEEWEEFMHHVSILYDSLQDRLEVILELQRELDEFIDKRRGVVRDDRQLWIRRNSLASIMEATEFIDGLNWKWWTNPKEVDKKYLLEELADILHFVSSAINVSGLTAEDIFSISTERRDRLSGIFIEERMRLKFNDITAPSEQEAINTAVELIREMSELYETPDLFKHQLKRAIKLIAKLTILIGYGEEDLFKAYVIKNFKNRIRQKSKKFRNGQYYSGEV